MAGEQASARGIGFRAEDYKQAAEEHVLAAQDLWQAQDYVLGIYAAGLAVEALFRGYCAKRSREFDARHDLQEWARKSGFDGLVPNGEFERYSVALSSMCSSGRTTTGTVRKRRSSATFKRMQLD